MFIFAYFYGRSLIESVDLSELDVKWPILFASFIVFFVSYVLLSWHWLRFCKLINEKTTNRQALSFLASQPYKYLPSSIFTFSYRAKFAKQLGLSVKQSSVAQLLENISLIGSGITVAVVTFVADQSYFYGPGLLTAGLIIAMSLMKFDFRFRVPKTKVTVFARSFIPNFLLAMIMWTVAGCAFVLTNMALGLVVDPVLLISANAAAYVVSILAIFAPGGIGVRELALATYSVNNSAIVIWRLLTFLADIILGFTAAVVIKLKYSNK